ncbi:hypothetical protein AX16_003921 [Volvariella volvacea WC 439]|nr:hypothetical protein AX16_003921 [Volvariella volvacea WC 439]
MSSAEPKSSNPPKRKLTPASLPGVVNCAYEHTPQLPTLSLISWTLGRGAVIWRIWPSVLFWTLHSAAVATLSAREIVHLRLPSVMITVLGVVIGFVISYRVGSGYDRYWMGRTCWSDVIKNSRAIGRLIWFHVPPRLTPKTAEEAKNGVIERSREEMLQAMNEKNTALDLVEGFAVALKHHVRGELGIYYEDLFHLVRPLHDDVSSDERTGFEARGPWNLRNGADSKERQWRGPVHLTRSQEGAPSEGENLPLAILHCLSEWASILEDRGATPGVTIASIMGSISALEDNLTTLERILTTPLPFVYSAHIRHTIWLYLFFLPFQLVGQYGYYAVPGVATAAFIYLGFIAAGEEIEQPFGYDKNDLNLDLFCREIIHSDIQQLKKSPCQNARIG